MKKIKFQQINDNEVIITIRTDERRYRALCKLQKILNKCVYLSDQEIGFELRSDKSQIYLFKKMQDFSKRININISYGPSATFVYLLNKSSDYEYFTKELEKLAIELKGYRL